MHLPTNIPNLHDPIITMSEKSPKTNQSPTPKKHLDITVSKSTNQATCRLNKDSVLLWRRILLRRYYLEIGSDSTIPVNWVDSDEKRNVIEIHDERVPFEWKIPHKDLFKSSIQLTINKKKLVLTLFYTTWTCSVQGQLSSLWVKHEFPKFKEVTESIIRTKGDNNDIDKQIEDVEMHREFFYRDSHIKINNITESTKSHAENTNEKKGSSGESEKEEKRDKEVHDKVVIEKDSPDMNIKYQQLEKKVEAQELELKQLKEVFHRLETAFVEREDKINNFIDKTKEKLCEIDSVKQKKVEIDTLLKEKTSSINKSLDEKFSEINTLLEEKARNIDSAINEKASEVARSLKDNKKELDQIIQEKRADIEKSMREINIPNANDKQTEHKDREELKESINEVKEICSSIKLATGATFQTLKRITEVNKQCSEIQSLINSKSNDETQQGDSEQPRPERKQNDIKIDTKKNSGEKNPDTY